MSQDIKEKLQKRSSRAEAAIEVCRQNLVEILPELIEAIDKMTWAEIAKITPYLPNLGTAAVEPFCTLLNSSRKQTAECITTALAEIGDVRAIVPLIKTMEEQLGQANALRARDALIQFGSKAVPSLLTALKSSNWEIRYYCVQALAVIGDPEILDPLLEIADKDRSAKVREAAEEALKFISYVNRGEIYKTYNGFYNPLVISTGGYTTDWQVDVINANHEAMLWRFSLEELEKANLLIPDVVFCRAIFSAYESKKSTLQQLDSILFMGELLDDDPLDFGVALLASEAQVEPAIQLMNAAEKNFQSLTGLGKWHEPSAYWLGETSLVPFFHLKLEKDLRYDWDDSYGPDETWQDSPENYSTNLTFTSAKVLLDQSWVYRDNLAVLKEQGIIKHIPRQKSYSVEHES
jgi:hypothetical protein